MKKHGKLLAVAFIATACASGRTAIPADAGDDSTGAGGDPGDAAGVLDAADAGPDALPAHTAVFEVRTRPSCVPDGPFLADRVTMVRDTSRLADLDVRAVAVAGPRVYAGTATGLFVTSGADGKFDRVPLATAPAAVRDIDVLATGDVAVAVGPEVVRLSGSGQVVGRLAAQAEVEDVFSCGGLLAVAGGLLLEEAQGALVPFDPAPPGVVRAGACAGGAPWVGTGTGLWRRHDEGWEAAWQGQDVRRVAAAGPLVAAATEDAVIVLDGDAARVLKPEPGGLPEGDVTSLDVIPPRTFVVGHAIGATRVDLDSGAVEHFHSLRWLPAEQVNAVRAAEGGGFWVATPAGLALLGKEQTTLEAKAARMQDQLDRWFWRMGGFMAAEASFEGVWADGPARLADNDNDGQWTEEAVAAMCYAFAVTGDERYRETARRAMKNMALLIDVPAQDFVAAGLGRGFVARSLVRDDEGDLFASKATQSNWHLVQHTDGHAYYWKDDTSSDETTGHFFGLTLYHDLCAADDVERAFVADRVTALAAYILDHGFTLPDLDGVPTTHGDWSPGRLAIGVDGPTACVEAGHSIEACIDVIGGSAFLDSVEVLAAMVAAWHVSGDPRFLDAFETLIQDHRYDELATFNENVATWTAPGLANYCDHELADLAFLTLNRHDPSPARRERWIASMLAAWEHEAGERNPLKSLAMAAAMPDPPGVEDGVRTLREYPEDLRDVRMDNGHRLDARRGGKDRFGEPQFTTVLPHDEIAVQRWDSNPYRVADGGAPFQRRAPGFWLLPYWGLRYHGAICP